MFLTSEDLLTELPLLMLASRGDLAKLSRNPDINMNAMELRHYVANTPSIRQDYHRLLADELQDHQLHIAERILRMAELQNEAFGDKTLGIPPDPKTAIELSREISRLILEGKGANISADSSAALTSKESVMEVLRKFLDGVT